MKNPNKNVDIKYVDGITVVDDMGKILYSVKYNPRYDNSCKGVELSKVLNKNLLEVYPTITPEDSTILRCLKEGKVIHQKNQTLYDYTGTLINTDNITLPIIHKGKVLGAIELSRDITTISDVYHEFGEINNIAPQNKSKNRESGAEYIFDDIITVNSVMLENIEKAKLAAGTKSSVLIYGPTGTGKELFVQSIHNYSSRRDKPFVAQNCAALPESLFEAILFGTTSGSYTGAVDKPGLFEMSNGGTLFLDEINSMPLNLQSKLLRVLQDGCIRRIGDTKDRRVDVRIIAAMNMDPLEAVKGKHIREDLFYRLNVVSIRLIPLRERKEDILVLTKYFIDKYNGILGRSVEGITKDVEKLFLQYEWPGNVRELQHVIEAAMNIKSSGKIGVTHLPVYLNDILEKVNSDDEEDEVKPLNEVIEVIEKRIIKAALKKCGGNVSNAAKILKLPRQTLQYKINKYGIECT